MAYGGKIETRNAVLMMHSEANCRKRQLNNKKQQMSGSGRASAVLE